uniref:Protein pet117 log mitochondrial n=1 Tax=Panstrongylus lignarius TaxID=156445 RepID=A0A224Y5T6_9HEMI
MSSTSKVVFATSIAVSATIIGYVHYKQEYDRNKMREGVLRDVEQQQMRKRQNIYIIEQQKYLTSKYKEQDN